MNRNRMPVIPNVDFTLIPEECKGAWVVIRLGGKQEILAQADSPQAAMRMSKASASDPLIVLTQVPDVPTAAQMKRSAR